MGAAGGVPWNFVSALRNARATRRGAARHPSVVPDAHGATGILSPGVRMLLASGCIVFVLRASRRKKTTRLRLCGDWPQWPAYGVACWANADQGQMPRRSRASRGRGEGPAVRQLLAILYSFSSKKSNFILILSNKYCVDKIWLSP
jgi:hypothetical protein